MANLRFNFSSLLYSLSQIGVGLILHPYQTMQGLVSDKVFIWMTLFPMGVLAVVTILWRFFIVPTVRLIFSCQQTQLFACDLLPFLSNWITFFCIYWQILLLYLFFRFWVAFKSE